MTDTEKRHAALSFVWDYVEFLLALPEDKRPDDAGVIRDAARAASAYSDWVPNPPDVLEWAANNAMLTQRMVAERKAGND